MYEYIGGSTRWDLLSGFQFNHPGRMGEAIISLAMKYGLGRQLRRKYHTRVQLSRGGDKETFVNLLVAAGNRKVRDCDNTFTYILRRQY